MAKNTSTASAATGKGTKAPTPAAQAAASTATTPSNVVPIVDLSKLTPEQLAALQKQLKEKSKEQKGKKDERFVIIDAMLQETEPTADGKGKQFKNSTRDILNALEAKNLVDTTTEDYDLNEIKKIQARKQFLEKKTDEKGKLVYPKGSFGYKQAERSGFGMRSSAVVKFFKDAEQVKTLTDAQRTEILAALGVKQ